MFLTSKSILTVGEVRCVWKDTWILYAGVHAFVLQNHIVVIFWGHDKVKKAYSWKGVYYFKIRHSDCSCKKQEQEIIFACVKLVHPTSCFFLSTIVFLKWMSPYLKKIQTWKRPHQAVDFFNIPTMILVILNIILLILMQVPSSVVDPREPSVWTEWRRLCSILLCLLIL